MKKTKMSYGYVLKLDNSIQYVIYPKKMLTLNGDLPIKFWHWIYYFSRQNGEPYAECSTTAGSCGMQSLFWVCAGRHAYDYVSASMMCHAHKWVCMCIYMYVYVCIYRYTHIQINTHTHAVEIRNAKWFEFHGFIVIQVLFCRKKTWPLAKIHWLLVTEHGHYGSVWFSWKETWLRKHVFLLFDGHLRYPHFSQIKMGFELPITAASPTGFGTSSLCTIHICVYIRYNMNCINIYKHCSTIETHVNIMIPRHTHS